LKKKKKAKKINEAINHLGKKSENKIRSNIHSLLEHDKSIELLKKSIHSHLYTLKGVKENTEIIAQQLNLPTKNDVANLAKLVIQIEEKIDALEERILHIGKHKSPRTSDGQDEQKLKEVAQLNRLLKMNLLMNMITIPDEKRVKRRD
jgi:hypothetical protein